MDRDRQFPGEPEGRSFSRRDFLNGALIASGGLAIGASSPMRALAKEYHSGEAGCADGDARFARGGNRPSAFNVAHWLRDQRLAFEPGGVSLAPGCDGKEGRFPIAEDAEEFDVIIAGGGLAGLSAAFYIARRRPGVKILLIEANPKAGGNASCDDEPPLPVKASTCGAYATTPTAGHLVELYRETGVDWRRYAIKDPFDAHFFDASTPGAKAGYSGWRTDVLGSAKSGKLRNPPYERPVADDLARSIRTLVDWFHRDGAPDDPPDASSPRYDYLSQMSFAAYLTDVLHCDPHVVDFYTAYTVDCLGGAPQHVNAHTVISFLSSAYAGKFFAYPGGTSGIAAQILKWLSRDDRAFTLKLQALALRVDADPQSSRSKVAVTYFKDGEFRRATGKALVVATQAQSARRLVEPLVDDERRAAWAKFNTVPAVVANVAVRDLTPFGRASLGFCNYYWGSRHWSNFIIADWTTADRRNGKRASVLTFYGAMTAPPEEFAAERMKLLSTPFSDYETSLRDDLSRLMRGANFDFDRDVSAVFVYRWGHSMILPGVNSVFGDARGPGGTLDRSRGPRRIACRPLGPISFAGQYTEGSPSVESAVASGHRAALEVLNSL